MDLHPIFVHFPISLLTLYSLLELCRRLAAGPRWMHTRAVLVVIGVIGAFFSLSTGEGAEHLFNKTELYPVLEMHSFIANVTTWIYTILGISYLLIWLKEARFTQSLPQAIAKPHAIGTSLASKIIGTIVAPILAIFGFLGLLLVGSLGAILVYGPEFDPMTSLIYRILFGQ